MKSKINVQHLIPKSESGSENDAVAGKTFASEKEAETAFHTIESNMLDINSWSVKTPFGAVKFFLTDGRGEKKYTDPEMNDLVKIKMPMLPNTFGNGFDWVYLNKITRFQQDDIAYLLLQMVPHSCVENAEGGIAHFYTNSSTNTFILAKSGTEIQVSVHGRNEIPNKENMKFLNKARNIFVGGGGIFGGSKLQWENFVDTMIKTK